MGHGFEIIGSGCGIVPGESVTKSLCRCKAVAYMMERKETIGALPAMTATRSRILSNLLLFSHSVFKRAHGGKLKSLSVNSLLSNMSVSKLLKRSRPFKSFSLLWLRLREVMAWAWATFHIARGIVWWLWSLATRVMLQTPASGSKVNGVPRGDTMPRKRRKGTDVDTETWLR